MDGVGPPPAWRADPFFSSFLKENFVRRSYGTRLAGALRVLVPSARQVPVCGGAPVVHARRGRRDWGDVTLRPGRPLERRTVAALTATESNGTVTMDGIGVESNGTGRPLTGVLRPWSEPVLDYSLSMSAALRDRAQRGAVAVVPRRPALGKRWD